MQAPLGSSPSTRPHVIPSWDIAAPILIFTPRNSLASSSGIIGPPTTPLSSLLPLLGGKYETTFVRSKFPPM
jgi:hypothetical protein